MITKYTLLVCLICTAPAYGQGSESTPQEPARESAAPASFGTAAADIEADLRAAVQELADLRLEIQSVQVPLSRELSALNAKLSEVQAEFQDVTRLLDSRNLDLTNLTKEIEAREKEAGYLSGLFSDYLREFESRLHIAEWQRFDPIVENARLAPENSNLTPNEVNEKQLSILELSLRRIDDLLGGARFQGRAVDRGLVKEGTFALLGPNALFLAADGVLAGTAEQRLDSQEPNIVHFAGIENSEAAAELVRSGAGAFPFDVTLGNAHKIEATREPLWEHVKKGGAVMIPIFAMATAALLVALFKWVSMMLIKKPSKRELEKLFDQVERGDEDAAVRTANELKGPIGQMLASGVRHLREPRDMIEELMYEKVLTVRLKLQSFLPFIAICAASAPLLGLLGTVTGIINTFKMITVYGSGDVKSLSGGISEALITTKFGLIVAIPSLLLHAFLSRKAKGTVDQMETAAVALVNRVQTVEIPRPSSTPGEGGAPDRELVRQQVNSILSDLMGPLLGAEGEGHRAPTGESRKGESTGRSAPV